MSEIEKQFFSTFDIKPKCNIETKEWVIPQITDNILLELKCIYNQYSHPFSIYGKKKEFLKDDILEFMINILNYFYAYEIEKYSKLKRQVRTLFEEV